MPPFFSLPEERGSKVAETMDRREFLALLAGLAQAGTGCRAEGPARDKWGVLLPQRPLTATGTQATCLGLGGYHIGWTTEALAQRVVSVAEAGEVEYYKDKALKG